MTTYTKDDYTVSGTFGGNYNPSKFKTDITNSAISRTIIDTGLVGDSIILVFDGTSTLSAGDIIILDTLVSVHDSVEPIIYSSVSQLNVKINEIKKEDYQLIGKFVYLGSNHMPSIGKILVNAYKESGDGSFTIAVVNNENGDEMAEVSFSNEIETVLDLGTIYNIPTIESKIEIFAKVSNKKSHLFIENIDICYL